ncbi:hypothetical protein G6F57_014470 [Rhizopus arrhizus]|nr:hypothetical protein G6F57_014470 [Rhizopus arrhizus]
MKRSARGFTLLEVIIAFALLGLALTLLLGSLSGGAKQVREAEVRTRAVLHAQSLLAEAGVTSPLQVGSQQGDWEQGRYHWELQVQPWVEPRAGNQAQTQAPGMPWLAELQLQVRWGDSEREQLRWRSLRLLHPGGSDAGYGTAGRGPGAGVRQRALGDGGQPARRADRRRERAHARGGNAVAAAAVRGAAYAAGSAGPHPRADLLPGRRAAHAVRGRSAGLPRPRRCLPARAAGGRPQRPAAPAAGPGAAAGRRAHR